MPAELAILDDFIFEEEEKKLFITTKQNKIVRP